MTASIAYHDLSFSVTLSESVILLQYYSGPEHRSNWLPAARSLQTGKHYIYEGMHIKQRKWPLGFNQSWPWKMENKLLCGIGSAVNWYEASE